MINLKAPSFVFFVSLFFIGHGLSSAYVTKLSEFSILFRMFFEAVLSIFLSSLLNVAHGGATPLFLLSSAWKRWVENKFLCVNATVVHIYGLASGILKQQGQSVEF